jgi:hypothetical protein
VTRPRFAALATALVQGALAGVAGSAIACGAPAGPAVAPIANTTVPSSTSHDLAEAYYDIRVLLRDAGLDVDADGDGPMFTWANGSVASADLERLATAGRGMASDVARALLDAPDRDVEGVWVAPGGAVSFQLPPELAVEEFSDDESFAEAVEALLGDDGRSLGAVVRAALRRLDSDYVDADDLLGRADLDELEAGRAVLLALAWEGLLQQGQSDDDQSRVRSWSAPGGAVVALALTQPCTLGLTLYWIADGASEPVTISAARLMPSDSRQRCQVMKGRATAGLSIDAAAPPLARAAAEEALSVASFERLTRELASFGAPAELIARAHAAADDERRHADCMARLAGSAPPAYASERLPLRDALSVARENAVEGCVHEAYAALIAVHQGAQARADLAPTYAAIAVDECGHAELAWDVATWLEARLAPHERAAVQAARADALAALPHHVARQYAADRAASPGHGVPSGEVAAALARGLAAQIAHWA